MHIRSSHSLFLFTHLPIHSQVHNSTRFCCVVRETLNRSIYSARDSRHACSFPCFCCFSLFFFRCKDRSKRRREEERKWRILLSGLGSRRSRSILSRLLDSDRPSYLFCHCIRLPFFLFFIHLPLHQHQ